MAPRHARRIASRRGRGGNSFATPSPAHGRVVTIGWGPANAVGQATEVRYSRYIGRVGVLAVALGVGMAVSTSYGIAPAAATPDSGSSTANAESEYGTDADDNAVVDGSDGQDDAESGDAVNGDTAPITLTEGTASTITVVNGEAPPVSISAQTTGQDDNDIDETDEDGLFDEGDDDDETGEDPVDETIAPAPATVEQTTTEPVPPVEPESNRADQDALSSSSEVEGSSLSLSATTISQVLSDSEETGTEDVTDAEGDVGVPEVVNAAVVMAGESAVTAEDTPSTVVPVGARDPIAMVVAIPAALLSAAVNLVVGIFEPIVGPGAPLDNAMLWGVLAWVRRQTNQVLTNDTPSVDDSREVELVLNPGQESAPIEFTGVDRDGDPVIFSVPDSGQPGGPAHGTITIDREANTWTYTPGLDWDGVSVLTDSFTVTVSDVVGGFHVHGLNSVLSNRGGHASSATIVISVTPANPAPVAAPDAYSTPEDTALTVPGPGVLGNDSDPEGEALSAALDTDASHGTVNLNADGSFTYTPDTDYNGTDSFSYTVSDGTTTDTATVTITVTPVNDAPVANPDTLAGSEDQALTFDATDLTGNDTDVDGDALTVASFTQPGHGTLTDNGDGTFTYTPAADYSGSDSFSYTVSDGTATATATVSINVGAANSAPVFDPDAVTRELQSPSSGVVSGSMGVTDPDGDQLTYTVVTGPAMGSVAIDPATGTYTYTPAQAAQLQSALASRVDSFTVEVSDSINAPVTFTVDNIAIAPEKIQISPGFDLPLSSPTQVVAGPDGRAYVLDVGSTRTIVYTISPDGDVEVLHEIDDAWGFASSLNRLHAISPDGERLYVLVNSIEIDENGLYIGAGRVEVIDTATGDDIGSIPVGDAGEWGSSIAIASNGSIAVASTSAQLGSDQPAPSASTLTILDASGTVIGEPISVPGLPLVMEMSPDGSHVYYTGIDASPSGDQAQPVSSVVNTATGVVETDLLADDFPGSSDIVSVLSPSPDGNNIFAVVGGVDQSGEAFEKIVVLDGDPASPTFLDVVHEFSSDPFDGYQPGLLQTFSPDRSVAYLLLTKVDESDGGFDAYLAAVDATDYSVISITPADRQANGFAMSGNGINGYIVDYEFVSDDSGVSDFVVGASIITIVPADAPANVAPVAVDDVYSTPEDQALTFSATSLTANDSDADGDALSVASFTQPGHGTLSDNGDGTFTYTPVADYNGADSFTYKASDGSASSALATVTVTVTPVNDTPVANPDTLATNEDEPSTFNATDLTGNDTDADGDALTVESFTQPSHGTVTDNDDGTFTYTPDKGYNGADSFSYTVSDGAATDTVAVKITVTTTLIDEPGYTILSVDDATGEIVGNIVVPQANGIPLNYGLDEAIDVTLGRVVVDAATGAWTYRPSVGALLQAWGTPEGDYTTFTIVAEYNDESIAVPVEAPLGVSAEALFELVEQLGSQPTGIVVNDDGRMYVINSGANTVSVINPADESMSTVTVGRSPGGITLDQYDRVFVTNTADSTVTVLDVDATLIRTITVGSAPTGIAASSGKIYVANFGSNNVSVIDPQNDYAVYTIENVGINPNGVAVDADGSVYVTNFGDSTIAVIDPAYDTQTDTIDSGVDHPYGIAIDTDGTIYVTDPINDVVSILTPAAGQAPAAAYRTFSNLGLATAAFTTVNYTNQRVTVVAAPTKIHARAGKVYITNTDGDTITVLDSLSLAATTITTGANPSDVYFDVNGDLYVTNAGSNTITVIDAAHQQVIDTVTVGVNTTHATIDDNGNLVLTSIYDSTTTTLVSTPVNDGAEKINITRIHGNYSSMAVSPHGDYIYALDASGITLIDTHTNTPIRTIALQDNPWATPQLTLTDDGTRLYILYGIEHEPDFRGRTVTSKIGMLDTVKLADITSDPWGATIELGIGVYPMHISVAPDGNHIYTTGTVFGLAGGGFPFEEYHAMWVIDITGAEPVISRWKVAAELGNEPHNVIASSQSGKHVYYWYSDELSRYYVVEFDTVTGTVVDKVEVGVWTDNDYVSHMALNGEGSHIYFNNGQVIDTTGEQLAVLNRRMERFGDFALLSPAGDRLYLVTRQGILTVLDTATGNPIGESIVIGNTVRNATLSAQGGTVYVLTGDPAPTTEPPASVEDLWSNVSEYTNDGNQGVFIQVVGDDEGTNRMIVYIGGTNDFFGAGNQAVIENIGAEAGFIKADQKEAIQDVLDRCAANAACGTVAEIMIVGFSQGGIDAQNLANVGHSIDGVKVWNGFDVPISTIVTFGSPIVANPRVVTLHIQDQEDEVVNLERTARWLGDRHFDKWVAGSLLSARDKAKVNDQIVEGNASTTPNVFNPFWHVHGNPETYRELSAAFDDPPASGYTTQRQAIARFLSGTAITSENAGAESASMVL